MASTLETILRRERTVLLEHELFALFAEQGLPVPAHHFVPRAELDRDAVPVLDRFSGRTVVKVVSEQILHKSDVGGVRFVDGGGPRAILEVARQMVAELPVALRESVMGVVVEEAVLFASGLGCELLLGLRHSEAFGPVYTLGFGGTTVEDLERACQRDQATILFKPGLTTLEQLGAKLRQSLFFRFATGGVRGVPGLGTAEAIQAELLRWVDALERLRIQVEAKGFTVLELELNPLVFAKRWLPVDALLRLGPRIARTAPCDQGKLARALAPRSVALMGVSEKMNVGHIILRSMQDGGFPNEQTYIIRSGSSTIDGVPCVPNVGALPVPVDAPVDLLVLSVAASAVPAALAEVFAAGNVGAVLLIPGGMGEMETGKGLEQQVLELLRESDPASRPVLIGNNSLGLVHKGARFDSLFIPSVKLPRPKTPPSNVAFVSQSGAFIITNLTKLAPLNPCVQVSLGNQLDARLSDVVEAVSRDERLRTIALYIEGFQPLDGERLALLLRKLTTAGREVVLYKAGRTSLGQHATMGHTASIAGDYRVFLDLMQDAGALCADSFTDFLDLVRLSAAFAERKIHGPRVALLSNAGYESVGMADSHRGDGYGLVPAVFNPATVATMRAALEQARIADLVGLKNPLDLTPMANDAVHAACMTAILDDPGVDAAVFGNVPLTSQVQSLPRGVSASDVYDAEGGYAKRAIALARATTKPFVLSIDAGPYYDALVHYLTEAGLVVFRSGDHATRMFATYLSHRLRRGA